MNHGEEHVAFYYELGLAISQWAAVEVRLANLVSQLCIVDVRDQWMLYMGFFSIENFRSKLQFADTMLLEKLQGTPHTDEWRSIHSRLQAASTSRNKLAHRIVVDYPRNDTEGRRIALIKAPKPDDPLPPAHKPPEGSICLLDINAFRREFFAIQMQLINFAGRARGHSEPLPRSQEQAAAPKTIRDLNAQIREVLGPPPKSWERKS